MAEPIGRIHASLHELLGADPIGLLRSGRTKAGLVEQARERLPATIEAWPLATHDGSAACVLIERLALQIDRAADWVARGHEALPWLVEQRRELLMAAYNLNSVALRCHAGMSAFGENASRYIQHPDELAERLQQILGVLEARLDELELEPVVPDRGFPRGLSPFDGQQLGTMVEQGVPLTLWAEGQWDPHDEALMHLRLTAIHSDGAPAAMASGRRRETGQLVEGDVEACPASAADILGKASDAAGISPDASIFIVDDVVVAKPFAGHELGARIVGAAADLLVGPDTLVLLAARPRANRFPPERRERLQQYWRDAGWLPLSIPGLWVRPGGSGPGQE